MKKKQIVISRRQVLRGAGGFTLGLPFLPSLVPVKAWAADVVFARQRGFVTMVNYNGGLFDTNTFPSDETLTQSMELVPGHVIRRGKLVRKVEDGDAFLSPVLGAPEDVLTDRIVGKMNVLRGLDMPYNLGHQQGGTLGNPWGNIYGCGHYQPNAAQAAHPTIDAVMAWSPSFYRDLGGVKQRHMSAGYGSSCAPTFYYASPTTKSGAIQGITSESQAGVLFDSVFGGGVRGAAPRPPGRPPVVDRVLESYRLLRNGNRRLSGEDRQRMDDVMSRLDELQRQLKVREKTSGCPEIRKPRMSDPDGVPAYKLINDVIAAAFICGHSRVAVIPIDESDFSAKTWDQGIWHNDLTHSSERPDAQAFIAEAYRNLFGTQYLDLVRKLDAVEESPGTTVLDNSVVMWTWECGERTHEQSNIPVFLAGSGGGLMRTGFYCDYRNRTARSIYPEGYTNRKECYAGLPWNQLLGTLLQAVGVPRKEYERPGEHGYGTQYRESYYRGLQAPGVWEQSGNFLPFLGTGAADTEEPKLRPITSGPGGSTGGKPLPTTGTDIVVEIDGVKHGFKLDSAALYVFNGVGNLSIVGLNAAGSLVIGIKGKSTGALSCGGVDYYISYSTARGTWSAAAKDGSCSINVTAYGNVGQKITGTFSGTLPAFFGVKGTKNLTNGTFSVIRSKDNEG